MLNVIMLNVIMLSVVMLGVVTPGHKLMCWYTFDACKNAILIFTDFEAPQMLNL